MDYIHRETCRLCESSDLIKVLSLTPTPPANAFVKKSEREIRQQCYPLDLFFCDTCYHLQLLDVVNPDILFSNYVYVSGTSPVFVKHFKSYAESVSDYTKVGKKDLVVDIGSNDGTLLRFFKKSGCNVLGIDPAIDIANEATNSGINTINGFFDLTMANKIYDSHGHAKVITANNVFAHIDNIDSVVKGIKKLLDNDGVFIFEVSYLVNLYQQSLFDMIYHEHLDYHSVIPLISFFKKNEMQLVKIEEVNTHGGSIRCYVKHESDTSVVDKSIEEFVELEKKLGINQSKTFTDFALKIDELGVKLKNLLINLISENKKIAGFGAPAKATTLMYHFSLDSTMIDYIVDDSPLKQNLYTPGFHIPVVDSSMLEKNRPDYLLILAWNFSESIINKNKAFHDAGGKFIIPLPKLEII